MSTSVRAVGAEAPTLFRKIMSYFEVHRDFTNSGTGLHPAGEVIFGINRTDAAENRPLESIGPLRLGRGIIGDPDTPLVGCVRDRYLPETLFGRGNCGRLDGVQIGEALVQIGVALHLDVPLIR